MAEYDRTHPHTGWAETTGEAEGGSSERGLGLVDWQRLAGRVWRLAVVWVGLGVVGALVTSALLERVAGVGALWAGIAAIGLLASVIATVALSAFGGMLRAGERRERLAGGDVGLLPPQVRTRLRSSEQDQGWGEHHESVP